MGFLVYFLSFEICEDRNLVCSWLLLLDSGIDSDAREIRVGCMSERPCFTAEGTEAQGSEETFPRRLISGRDEIQTQAVRP